MEVLHKYFTAWGWKCVTFGIISLVPLILPDVSDARHGSVQENVSDWEVKLSFHASRVPWRPHAHQAQPRRIARAGHSSAVWVQARHCRKIHFGRSV